MKKLIDAIKKMLGMSDKSSTDSSAGFTLIELLVVIAVIGVLAAAVLLAVDPLDRIRAANDSRTINEITQIGNAADAYAVTHNGFYANSIAALQGAGDLRSIPTTAYTYNALPAGCASGTSCTSVTITFPLTSKRYINAAPTAQNFFRFESTTGKKCPVNTAATVCP